MGIEVDEFCRGVFVPLSLLLQASSISLTPFSLIPQFPALPHFLSLLLHMLLFLSTVFCPTLLSLSPVLLVLLTSCIRRGGKAPPDSAASCLFYLPHHLPHHLQQTSILSLLQQFSTFLNFHFSSSLSFTLHTPIFFLTFITTATIFSSSSLLHPPPIIY